MPDFLIDERLREKEFGVLDRLTRRGIEEEFPDQAEFRASARQVLPPASRRRELVRRHPAPAERARYHQPPPLRTARVLIVSHQVVVLCLRYLLENMTEEQILAIDREGDVANCSVTEYRLQPGPGQDRRHGTAPLQLRGAAARSRSAGDGRAR